MKSKALLSVVLSAVMIIGSVSPAFAAGQVSSNELTAQIEASDPESQNEVVPDNSGQNDNGEDLGQESVDEQETAEEEGIGTELETEETGTEEENPDGDVTNTDKEKSTDEGKKDSAEEEEEKPETLVGAEGERVSVGENVTAEFDSQTGTVTFYSQGGTLSSGWASDLGINQARDTVKEITISDDSDVMYLPVDSSFLFSNFNNLRILNLSKTDTSNVSNMSYMFDNCSVLRTLDVNGFDTSNVTNMSAMFDNCSGLRTLDVSRFDTSNVTNVGFMFNSCSSLQTLDVSGFDTSNVTNMHAMFNSCSSLQTLDVSGFDTSNVTDMNTMFYGCSSLQDLDVSRFDTSNVRHMVGMFGGCRNIQTLEVSGFNTTNVTDMSRMFKICSNLRTLDVSRFNTSNVTGMSEMFSGCSSIQKLDVSNFDISNVNAMDKLFNGCTSLQRLDLSSFDMDWVKDASNMLSISWNAKLLVILTPINVQETVFLPYTFVDSSGTEYNSLPEGLSESIRLTKKGADIPVDLEILSLSDDCYGANGTQASFHIDAQGSSTVSYQWQYKLAGSNEWNTSGQASAKTADYTFELQPSYDNMQVRCIISDEYGFEVISETRNVNVFALTSQPTDAVAADGQMVAFNVTAIGQGLKYQWYYKRPNASWRKVIVEGYNASSLPITGGEKNNGTSYRCVITDSVGNSITSSSAKITVVANLQIINLSEDFYGKVGTNASFHIDAVGKGNLTYQWQYKLAGETRWRTPSIASAKTTDYVFKLRTSYENIQVRCIVKDEAGNTCTSDVRKANVFAVTQQPNHVFAELGENVTFSVEGIGQNLTYQWYYRRLDGGWKKVIVAGYNTATLTITAQIKNNGSQYRCYVYDGLGNLIKSQAAMLIERNEEYEG